MIFDKKHETMSVEEMRALQLERLRHIVRYAYDHVPFYKKKYDEAGFDPDSIRTLDDIRRIPFTVKSDLRDNYPYGLISTEKKNLMRIHASSGTSGKPTVVCYTKKDMKIWTECCARLAAAAGVRKSDIVQISFGYGLFTGALGMHQGCERLGAAIIPASAGNTERQVMLLKDLQATVLVCTPSYALYIGEMIEKLGYDIKDFKLRLGLFGSEASTEEMHREIARKLNIFTNDNYGLSEIIGPGVSGECSEKCGMHINEDHFYPEVLDPETFEPVPDGTYGELVLTTLTKEGMPVIRYRTKDITTLDHTPCKCGRTTVRMAKLRGRTDDMLIIRGVNVFPSQIEGVLMNMPEVGGQYEIVVTREGYMDKIEVKVEVADGSLLVDYDNLIKLREKIRHNLKTVLQLDAQVKLVEPLTLQRFEGKSKRVTDLRKL
ncbi:MAG TPA: phenylacetate--CoA ligase [Candidatus Stercoripulliclostridium merdipullorum]|uniref:Phenylacetate-coenzyme A ligase n=1 Tax=Candidatus Stercoripulliclostridium merdipullorum TaxID=2840952 RepID=A0A9D1ND86_9FIRM|nr:phenylacetate--CoA ligase [Candidatus Stercoripulliclostridium merdipullorum]